MTSSSRTNTKAMLGICAVAVIAMVLNWRAMESVRLEEREFAPLPTDMPPTLALTTVALGPARSLVANTLWWRAVRMQDEGNYFEAIQLASWISALQPKLVRVWTYQSWNMAFNITAEMPNPEDRWTWVRSGLELLRDDALDYNPRDPYIRTEISRIFFQKMSNTADPHWRYYTRQWAIIMIKYIPSGSIAEINSIAAAPDTLAELRTKRPDAAKLLDEAKGIALDLTVLEVFVEPERLSPVQRDLLEDPENAGPLQLIRHFVTKKRIVSDLKMDLAEIQAVDAKYGPFDWRLPQAHAVYWGANEGMNHEEGREDFEFPIVRQAMVQSFMIGKLVYLSRDDFITTYNLQIAANTDEYMHFLLENRPVPGLKNLAMDFHQRGSLIFYLNGYEEEARDFFESYQDYVKEKDPKSPKLKWTFEEFISEDAPEVFLADAGGQEKKGLVLGTLRRAYMELAMNQPERAVGFMQIAKLIHQRNQERYKNRPDLQMESLDELKRVALDQSLTDAAFMPVDLRRNLELITQGGQMIEFPERNPSVLPPLNLGKHHHGDDH